jgi:hypothetical protein
MRKRVRAGRGPFIVSSRNSADSLARPTIAAKAANAITAVLIVFIVWFL